MKPLLVLLALSRTVAASPLHADAEIDPTAYVLAGNSLHVGIGYDRFRLDVGNFAMKLPQFVHGDDGFDVSFDGWGIKLQMFPWSERQRGWLVGVDAGITRVWIARDGMADRQVQVGAGVHAGYRIAIGERFYATPWLGVGYQFGARDVTFGGATYRANHVTVFPAVHLGFQFE